MYIKSSDNEILGSSSKRGLLLLLLLPFAAERERVTRGDDETNTAKVSC
jgi:hypothetical protein